MQCPACGVENAEGAQFCSQCGAAIVDQSPEPILPAQETPVSEPAATPEPPASLTPAEFEPPFVGPPPVEAPPAFVPLETSAVAPKSRSRIGLVIAIGLGLVVVVAAIVGAVLYMNSVKSARAAAETAVARAATAVADAELCAEDGNDAVSLVEESKTRLAQAKAKIASGSLFSAAPYREAQSLAGQASSAADKVLEKLDAVLDEADSLRQSADYQGAVQAWSGLAKTYPRSSQAADARQAALDMLTGDVSDAGDVELKDDLQLSIDVAAMFPSDSKPAELSAHVNTALLDAATTELDTLQEISTANASWAREIARKGSISGAVVNGFQNQEYDSSDVEWIQKIQGMVGPLGQPEQMARLYTVLTEATSLAAECRSVADHPARSTSTSETFTPAQIKVVRDKAATMQRDIDEGRLLADALSKTI
jgi:hypothetical protein